MQTAPAQDVDAATTRLALTLEEPSAPVKESPAAVSQATVGDVQLARTYDGPPTEETTDGTSRNDASNDTTAPRETSPGTTDGATDGATDSSGSRDGSGRDDTKRRKKQDRPNHDGGSNVGTGIAVVGAAAIIGAIAYSAQKEKRLKACENEVRALQGRSIVDVTLDPARYIVKQVPKASPGAVAPNTIIDVKVKDLQGDRCVVKLTYAETPAVPSDRPSQTSTTPAQPDASLTTAAQPDADRQLSRRSPRVAQSPVASQPPKPAGGRRRRGPRRDAAGTRGLPHPD